ncbi:Eco57I restriction-modification methylase domain-containing protein [Mycoplasmoides alvi]|uniref:Eco57I restriction-modification methylase domain-containing protein n=1 Tax=Mycoplasmoides alvi TaxID=78580 RepID=UPI00051CA844|nr:Eco57I restriction-modification methylase domain-containing protein [Mycoplasmoides alvi]
MSNLFSTLISKTQLSNEYLNQRNAYKYNVIYIYEIVGQFGKYIPNDLSYYKIGQTHLPTKWNEQDWKNIDQEKINEAAIKRIKDQSNTAGLNFQLIHATIGIRKNENNDDVGFSDKDFHKVLIKRGVKQVDLPNKCDLNKNVQSSTAKEWFQCSPHKLIDYLNQYKNGAHSLSDDDIAKIELREPQRIACDEIIKAWNKKNDEAIKDLKNNDYSKNQFLLNAIMRFGKCITTYSFINEMNISKTLIFTHRPIVKNSWQDDFNLIFKNKNDLETLNKKYEFLDKKDQHLINDFNNLIYFTSIQDLRGKQSNEDFEDAYLDNEFNLEKEYISQWKESNKRIFEMDWDLIVIDEAHEGILTELASQINTSLKKKFALYLSGTPFNFLSMSDFKKEFGTNYHRFDYEDEQKYKKEWDDKYPTEANPYADLPDIKLWGISIDKKNLSEGKELTGFDSNFFNFNLFFELNDDGSFKNEQEINKWLDNISSHENDEFLLQMPFHETKRHDTKHSLWLLPRKVGIANALEKLLKKHNFFRNYQIFNVAGNCFSENDFKNIKSCTDNEEKQSIILTIGRLTQGVTLPGLSTILMLDQSTSSIKYLQTIFRAKTPSPKNWKKIKTAALVFDFNPDRCLDITYQLASKDEDNKDSNKLMPKQDLDESIQRVLNYWDVMIYEDNAFQPINISIFNKTINKVFVNRIINQGFDAPKELIDLKRFDSYFKKNPENVAKYFNMLFNKCNNKKVKEKNIKLTNNALDIAIVELEKSSSSLATNSIDPGKEDKKLINDSLKKLREVLRNIFPRIPYMLIGKFHEIREKFRGDNFFNFDIDNFCNMYDELTWKEIMPHTFQKKEFKEIIQNFINKNMFFQTCIGYMQKIDDITKINDNLDRCHAWFGFFDSLHSLDRETVFTPFKVIKYQVDSLEIDWKTAYLKKQTFIDINVKTALYPLYIAQNLLKAQLELEKKQEWRKIIYHQIFLICKLELMKEVAINVLKFNRDDTNVLKFDIIEKLSSKDKKSLNLLSEEIMSKVKRPKLTKFDYCISNPPYQIQVKSDNIQDNSSSANVIFDKFVHLGTEISNITCMIFPAKWMIGGKGLDNFRKLILDSKNIEYLIDCENYKQLFPTIILHSGLSIMTINNLGTYKHTKVGYFNDFKPITKWYERKLNEYGDDIFIIDNKKYNILKKIEKKLNIKNPCEDWKHIDTMDKHVQPLNTFNLETNFYKKNEISIAEDFDSNHTIKVYYITVKKEGRNKNSHKNRTFGYISSSFIETNHLWLNKWKICMPKAGGGG